LTDTCVNFDRVNVTRNGITILESVSASVPRGSCTAVVGPNGAGKTTLLLALLGQIPYRGTIRLEAPGSNTMPRIGYVPQRLPVDRGMPITVLDLMVMGHARRPLWCGISRIHRDRALHWLSCVHASTLAKRALGVLSGGEWQRILLALALQQEPDLLLLDEPAAGIDLRGEHLLCELMESLRERHGFTQLMVSHDLATVTHHASHVILLNRSVIAAGKPADVLVPHFLSIAFGLHMGVAAAPWLHTSREGSDR